MTRRTASAAFAGAATLAAMGAPAAAAEPRTLPPPHTEGGMPLLSALRMRRSTRSYAARPLDEQTLSDLLWSAFGVNRPGDGRTAPYWRHVMVIDVYVAMADGTWLYEPASHTLARHGDEDLRARTGLQDFVATAPVDLVYVAHGERMAELPPQERRLYASVDAGFIGQNVYLYCAAAGLGSVFRGALDARALGAALGLPPQQFVTFAQTVGFPMAA